VLLLNSIAENTFVILGVPFTALDEVSDFPDIEENVELKDTKQRMEVCKSLQPSGSKHALSCLSSNSSKMTGLLLSGYLQGIRADRHRSYE
jgi:hypothetical protein